MNRNRASGAEGAGDVGDAVDVRREQFLDAALALLQELGYRDTTMLLVASRAQASKNTLYQHFATKQALFASLVSRTAAQMNAALAEALSGDRPPEQALQGFAGNLLRVLSSPTSLAINRAAIAEAAQAPELAQSLMAAGRENTGPLLLRYLRRQVDRGVLRELDAQQAFEVLIGLIVGDLQVRLLLGVAKPPSDAAMRARARRAAAQFMILYGPT